jgi:hypothetical protein
LDKGAELVFAVGLARDLELNVVNHEARTRSR